jgi:acetoin:2,6-dichlorophenolindophenol oxidoreductase subunit alpha
MAQLAIASAKVSRRMMLKGMGVVGATAAVVSACAPSLPLPGNGAATTAKTGAAGLNLTTGVDLKQHTAEDGYRAAAKLSKEQVLEMYRLMLTSREWELTFKDLFLGGQEGLYGYAHLSSGEEASAVGIISALTKEDYITSFHRGHAHLIAKGGDINKMSAEMFGKQGGSNLGFGGSMHITEVPLGILGMNGIVGGGWLLGAGAAYGSLVKGTKQVAVSYGGDGATNSAYFVNALRNAALYKLPFIAVVEHNGRNVSVPTDQVTPIHADLSSYAEGLRIARARADGMDPLAVYDVATEAVARARAGEGPTLIELKLYRYFDHSGFAGAKVGQLGAFGLPYRTDEEVRQWLARDPIPFLAKYAIDQKIATQGEIDAVTSKVKDAVAASIEFARKSPVQKPEMGLRHVYAEGAVRASQIA